MHLVIRAECVSMILKPPQVQALDTPKQATPQQRQSEKFCIWVYERVGNERGGAGGGGGGQGLVAKAVPCAISNSRHVYYLAVATHVERI